MPSASYSYSTAFEYDVCGNVTVVTDALGGKTTRVYDSNGNLLSVTDSEGYTTSYTYDKLGRVTSTIDANGAVTTVTYDANGNIVKLVQADGHEITYSYNARNELVSYVDAEGYIHSFTYDGNGNVTSETDGNGNTTSYTYDGLDRVVSAVNGEDGISEVVYDADGRMVKVFDEEGGETSYSYDADDRLVAMTDAEGYVTTFTYDAMDRVVTMTDANGGVTSYTYTKRGEVATKTDAEGYVISYEYDGNGNLVSKTDPDGYTTEYTYNALDLVTKINYNDAKEVSYRYNKAGDLVSMTDWLGTTTFELDLLHQLTAATDHAGKRVEYTYDGVGNQTSIAYPDGTTATYDYDLVHNQTKVTETDGSETSYTYDGMGRVTEMRYPNGWVEYYTYDKMGRILKVEDTHPSEKPAKTQKHTYAYDANGNMTYEYMRGNGTGQAKNETLYTYDALNRLITAHDNYGNSTRTYTYDSLGNLTYETGVGSHNCDYIYNNLNQQIGRSSDNWKSHTASTYDKRGNLILEEYIKNSKVTTAGAYTYDETNKMVRGINGNAEESIYTYNGLGALMEQTWIIAKNGYGYHDVSATAVVDGEVVVDSVTGKRQQKVRLTPEELEAANAAAEAAEAASAETGITETSADANTLTATLVTYGNAANGNNGNSGNGNGTQDKPTGSDVKNTSTVVKQFVVDFSSETYKPLMEHEVNGLDYRYVYSDKARLSVVVQGIENGSASLLDDAGELHAYYHCDYLGTTDYLTSAVNSKVISWTSYSEWGEITHNAVLKCGARELDLVKLYATHDFDAVLNMYYAKARFYDVDNRRFTAVDPILDASQYDLSAYTKTPVIYNQYLYVKNGPLTYIDEDGEFFALVTGAIGAVVGGATAAYKEYKSTGKVTLGTVAKGAAVGAVVGAGAGVLAGVVSGAGALAATAKVTATTMGKAVATAATAATVRTSSKLGTKTGAGERITPKDVVDTVADTTKTVVAAGVPVVGAAVATMDAVKSSKTAVNAAKEGNYLQAAVSTAETALNVVSAYSGFKAFYCSVTSSPSAKLAETAALNQKSVAPETPTTSSAQASGSSLSNLSAPSSKVLRKNLIASGSEAPDYANAAHHIVAGSAKKASTARSILQKFGVDINDASNGVFLPTANGVSVAANHRTLHTNLYYDKVNSMLLMATSKDDVLDILDEIRDELLNGTF